MNINRIDNSSYLNHVHSKFALGSKGNHLPGATNIFRAPVQFINGIKSIYSAYKIGDIESLFENNLKVLQTPLSFTYAALKGTRYLVFLGILLNVIQKTDFSNLLNPTTPIAKSITSLGLGICAIEGVLETFGLYKTIRFLKKCYSKDAHYITNLYQKYFQVSPRFSQKVGQYIEKKFPNFSSKEKLERKDQILQNNLEMKKRKLTRQVRPWLSQEIENSSPQIMKDLNSNDPLERERGKIKAEGIFKNLKIQSQKKLLAHSIGLLAVVITVIGLILGFFAFSFLIPLALILVGALVGLTRYTVYCGYIDSKGWNFSFNNCIPLLFKRIFKIDKKEETPLPLSEQSSKFSILLESVQKQDVFSQQKIFNELKREDKNLIFEKIWEEAFRPQTEDLQWGEHHVFEDMHRFAAAVNSALPLKLQRLPKEEQNRLFGKIYTLAGSPVTDDLQWGEHHALNDLKRLADAF